jgi:hypothetical protein
MAVDRTNSPESTSVGLVMNARDYLVIVKRRARNYEVESEIATIVENLNCLEDLIRKSPHSVVR